MTSIVERLQDTAEKFKVPLLKEAAITIQSLRDRTADLERQLAARDVWIVDNGHWNEFTSSLSEPVLGDIK